MIRFNGFFILLFVDSSDTEGMLLPVLLRARTTTWLQLMMKLLDCQ